MRTLYTGMLFCTALLGGSLQAAEIGIVNFATCIAESKVGKKEQQNLEAMRQQMSGLIEGTEKEIQEIAAKFDDTEYLDGLSPKAEEELKTKFQNLQEDLGRYQNQFYQVLNHANYQMLQKINHSVSSAAKEIAEGKNLDYVINKEACFYSKDNLDVTDSVIGEMNKEYEIEEKAAELTDTKEDLPNSEQDSSEQAG